MRTAFSLSGSRDGADAVRVALLAEELGFDDVWVTEDYCERGAFALAGAIAAATQRLRVGIGVVNPWTRHPILLAMEFAGLDEISGGRAVLGLGASNSRWMSDQLGIPFDRPIGRLRETLDILRPALAGEPVEHDGDHFRVHARLSFSPTRSDPSIVMGVKGRQALALAAHRADGVLLSILSSPAYVSWVREQVGPDVELSAYVSASVDDDPGVARDRLRAEVATYLGVHGAHDITRVAGLDPELALAFHEGWLAGRPRVDLVDDALLTTFAIAGAADQVEAGLAAFADAGLDALVVRDDPTQDPQRVLSVLRELSARVNGLNGLSRPGSPHAQEGTCPTATATTTTSSAARVPSSTENKAKPMSAS